MSASPASPPCRLDPLQLPLHGSRLIEASAGTGKTWTIAALYLRLVLGHGETLGCAASADEATPRALLPAEILVMTFTRAATRELSARIRSRLLEAAAVFRAAAAPADPLLAALLAAYPDPGARKRAAWRLAMAAESMDDAAVFTIDGWCQRMLREHAVDSGMPFDEELIADEDALLQAAVHDYWRQQCYPLQQDELATVLAQWPSPAALGEDLGALVASFDPATPLADCSADERSQLAGDSLARCLARARASHQQQLCELASGWHTRIEQLRHWFDAEDSAGHWDRRTLRPSNFHNWLTLLDEWAAAPLRGPLELSKPARERLSAEGLRKARKANTPPLVLPAEIDALQALLGALEQLRTPGQTLRLHALIHISARFARLKQRARSFGFADLPRRLAAALAGEHGERLRARILAQYPVALIDEFQDTSPLQYRLFDLLYRCADNDPAHGLLLIGDPKQSIYAFRGADIHSYLRARHDTRGRHYMLDTNYRSSKAVVAVINHLFASAEARGAEDGSARGAFLFPLADAHPGTTAAADHSLPFSAVQAHGLSSHFRTAAGPAPALSLCHDLELRQAEPMRALLAARCAAQIQHWLEDEEAGFADVDGNFERLQAADIAVLVRTGTEAAAVRAALQERGIAAVYLSERDSVFASAEARDLLRWLQAVASPLDARRLRAALATPSLDLPLATLAELASDDEAFDRYSEHFQRLHRRWRERGVLAMLRTSLHLFALPARWLQQPGGERRLTNYLHLAELLQQASSTVEGEQGLVRWLAAQLDRSEGGDEQVLRLESDAELVKIVTIHKSKGLEYALVCLPFACSLRASTRKNSRHLLLSAADGERRLKLNYDDEDLEQAEHDRLAEDLRLLYVALTRARHALWLGFSALRGGKQCINHRSAAGYLFGGSTPRAEQDWLALLEASASALNTSAQQTLIALEALDSAGDALTARPLQRTTASAALVERPAYDADFEREWTLASFSALVRGLDGAASPLAPTLYHRPGADELSLPAPAAPSPPALPALPEPAQVAAGAAWHRLPRGARAGNFIHELLEWLSGEGFALGRNPTLQQALRKRCARAGWEAHGDTVLAWLQAVLDTPLPSLGCSLANVDNQVSELEFWMPAAQLVASELDTACQRSLLGGHPRAPLPARALHGMLMGFADLVIEHQGRYWVLDYKTNHLGDSAAAYHRQALEAAMATHRYDLQATLYLLALHRLLRSRLGAAYQPTQQLGGALYLFMRGIDAPGQGEYAIHADPALIALLDEVDRQLDQSPAPQLATPAINLP